MIPLPSKSVRWIKEDGTPSDQFYNAVLLMARLDPAYYPGDPSGNVEANKGKFLWDTTNSVLYFKESDQVSQNRTQGWVLV